MHRLRLPVMAAAESPVSMQDGLGLAAEHGFFFRQAGSLEWDTRSSCEDMAWRSIVGPILQQYTESTDGAHVEKKESAFVWHYAAADPDFGSLQARCCTAVLTYQSVPGHPWAASSVQLCTARPWRSAILSAVVPAHSAHTCKPLSHCNRPQQALSADL